MHIGTCFATCGHPIDRSGKRSIDENDALVAFSHLGYVALHYYRLAIELGEHLQQSAQIFVVLLDAEDARSAVAVERL